MPEQKKDRILVVDDHPLYRLGLTEFINHQPDLICCGEAGSVDEALQACRRDRPDLILLDMRLKQEDAADLLHRLQDEFKNIRVLVLSNFAEDLHAERMLKAGARGYVMKEVATESILEAIRTVLAGEIYLSRRMTARLLEQGLVPHQSHGGSLLDLLSPREHEVFRLLGCGMKTRDIALKLGRSFKTVESHKENIKRKMSLPSTTAVIHSATRYVENGDL